MRKTGIKTQYQLNCIRCKQLFKSSWQTDLCEPCRKKNKQALEQERREEKIAKQRAVPKSPELGYEFKLFTLSAETLPQFAFLENKRRISTSNVQGIYKVLMNEKHFDSPIVVSKSEGLFHIIDGNHRIEAFKRIVSKYEKFKLEVLLIVYDSLEDDERIEVFRRWNVGRPQSTDDFIQSVAHKIPFIRWLKKDFPIPVSVYRNPDSINVRVLCNGYLAAKRYDDRGHGLNRANFVDALLVMTEKDFGFLVEFAKQFKAVFGELSRTNTYYRTTFFQPVIYLAYEHDNDEKLFKGLAACVMGDAEILQYTKMGGREANKLMIQMIKDKLKLAPVLKV